METRHEGGRNREDKGLGKDVGSVVKPQHGELCSLHGPPLKLDPILINHWQLAATWAEEVHSRGDTVASAPREVLWRYEQPTLTAWG